MTDQAYDLGDKLQTEQRGKVVRIQRESADDQFVRMMAVPEFRRFVWDLLTAAHLFEVSTTGDPHHTYFREGERNAGLRLMAMVNRLCPEQYGVMLAEANSRDSEIKRSTKKNGEATDG